MHLMIILHALPRILGNKCRLTDIDMRGNVDSVGSTGLYNKHIFESSCGSDSAVYYVS